MPRTQDGFSPSIGALIERRFPRRVALGMAAAAGMAPAARGQDASTLTFTPLAHGRDHTHHVVAGYDVQVLIRWGDPVLSGAPTFDPHRPSVAAQEMQLGYNCDYLNFKPLPRGSANADHGVLVINHEYTNTNLIFPGLGAGRAAASRANAEQSEIEQAAHGFSVVEIRRADGRWSVVRDSAYNRRVTGTTPIALSGPAAGHALLCTNADPTGTRVLGTLSNCAGGDTPWGTVLTAEENIDNCFGGDPAGLPNEAMYHRYGIRGQPTYAWSRHQDRFDVTKEPHEPHRFGWIVEFDPYDPAATPVKRTALGRFKHECCEHALAADGRVVFYMGDDQRMNYVYKFVTARPWNPANPAANRDLLDDGTLYVARFDAGGSVAWLPLAHGQGPLTAANGFASQAEVLVFARKAADLLSATPMDRPEDVQANPVTGRVYVVMTYDETRKPEAVNAANPRGPNPHGHIIEITNPGGDHGATTGEWTIFIAAGRPGVDAGTRYNPQASGSDWLSGPDNINFDRQGRMLIATDGQMAATGLAEGLYFTDTTGPGRGLPRLFFLAPTGAEICGVALIPDDTTLFLAIQHPGEDRGSSFDNPSTRWPDFQDGAPPRPSVIAITKRAGGPIGG